MSRSVSGLVSLASKLHAVIGDGEAADPAIVAEKATVLADRAHARCRRAGIPPADLPVRSRQAVQWLTYLGSNASAEGHLQTVKYLHRALRRDSDRPVTVRLEPSSVLYRSRVVDGVLDVSVHQGFQGAPNDVLDALAGCAVRRRAGLDRVRRYARSQAYRALVAELEASLGRPELAAEGHHYDLEEVFRRVNHRYFQGQVPAPRLRWSRRATRRKLGHYDQVRDTVVLSRTLDRPEVPRLLVEFVMYHELLHKQLGVIERNGRRRAHTSAFRQAEQRFVGYDEVQRLLGAGWFAGLVD